MPRNGVGVVHDVAEVSRGLDHQLLRLFSLGASIANSADLFVLDHLDELVVAAELLPGLVVKPVFLPDCRFGKQLFIETAEVDDELAAQIAGEINLRSVQANDGAHLLTSDWLCNRHYSSSEAECDGAGAADKRFEARTGRGGEQNFVFRAFGKHVCNPMGPPEFSGPSPRDALLNGSRIALASS